MFRKVLLILFMSAAVQGIALVGTISYDQTRHFANSGNPSFPRETAVPQRPVREMPSIISPARIRNLHVPFIINRGQADESIKFYANTFGGTAYVTGEGAIVYEIRTPESGSRKSEGQLAGQEAILKEQLVGAKIVEIKGEGEAVAKVSYFRGNDPSKWVSNISTYELVDFGEVYDGIELKLKAHGNNMEKLFHIRPAADPEQIEVGLEDAKSLRVNEEGELVAETEKGDIRFTKPVAYQEIDERKVYVEVAYAVSSGLSYSFKLGDYDKSRELVIDPLLASTFLGGRGQDTISSLAIDKSGNVYVAGHTNSQDFPITAGAYDSSCDCNYGITTPVVGGSYGDVFVAKFNSDLTTLISSTFLGGDSDDGANALTVDSDGNIYIAGGTSSKDFPITSGAYDTTYYSGNTYNSNRNSFVSKLNADLTKLLASTYLGGNSSARSISIGPGGSIYIAGSTSSPSFPTTGDAFGPSYKGSGYYGSNVFISKLSGDLSSLLASTYLGGSATDTAGGMVLDSGGNVYVAGGTTSKDFPVTTGPLALSGDRDAFVSKLSGDLTHLLASRYLGGSNGDTAGTIAINPAGYIYVAGYTGSADFPVTPGAYDTSFHSSAYSREVFISKFSGDLTTLAASTFLGGTGFNDIYFIALSATGDIYATGLTSSSSDFPISADAFDSTRNSNARIFIAKVKGDLTALLASTFLGSRADYFPANIAVDSSENVYAAGATYASDFPVTPDAFSTTHNNHTVCINNPSTQDDLMITVFVRGSYDHICGDKISSSHEINGTDIQVYYSVTPPKQPLPCVQGSGGGRLVTEEIGNLPAGEYKVTIYRNKELVASRIFEVKDVPSSVPVDCDDNYFGSDAFISKFDPNLSGGNSADISVTPQAVDFGAAGVGKTVSRDVMVTNAGSMARYINSIAISGTSANQFIQSGACPFIKAGGECKITVVFSPRSYGFKDAAMNILFDGASIPTQVDLIGSGGKQQYLLTVSKPDNGTITSSPAGINCGPHCFAPFTKGQHVRFTAKPAAGYSFKEWGGACSGSKPTCTVTMDEGKTVSATFTLPDLSAKWLDSSAGLSDSGYVVAGKLDVASGEGSAAKVMVKFYLSDDAKADQSDQYLGSVIFNAVRAGKSVSKSLKFKSNAKPYGKYLIAVIDPDGKIAETNKDNNIAVSERCYNHSICRVTLDNAGIWCGTPAAVYCVNLGYDEEGGICFFPDGSTCSDWSFLRGECGQNFSYCGINGFTLKSTISNMGTWTISHGVCYFSDGAKCDEMAYFLGECAP